MYSLRRSGQVTPLHNTHKIPTTLTRTTTSALWSHYPRHSNHHKTHNQKRIWTKHINYVLLVLIKFVEKFRWSINEKENLKMCFNFSCFFFQIESCLSICRLKIVILKLNDFIVYLMVIILLTWIKIKKQWESHC